MTDSAAIWVIAALLAWATYRGARAAWYIRGLYLEERRLDKLRRRIGGPAPPVRRLLGWLRWLTAAIAAAGAYFGLLLSYRLLTGEPSPEWIQPISAGVVIGLLLTGDYIASRLRKLEDEGRLDNIG